MSIIGDVGIQAAEELLHTGGVAVHRVGAERLLQPTLEQGLVRFWRKTDAWENGHIARNRSQEDGQDTETVLDFFAIPGLECKTVACN